MLASSWRFLSVLRSDKQKTRKRKDLEQNLMEPTVQAPRSPLPDLPYPTIGMQALLGRVQLPRTKSEQTQERYSNVTEVL